ncbi:hypothetical protein [Polaromonas sp.]|uniref:hypothetical protein n=1 Tax=Polaromonas sp. TaxID=1869339 RepID=UPI00352AA25F
MDHKRDLSAWLGMLKLFCELPEAEAKALTAALEPLSAVDQKLSGLYRPGVPFTPEQELARAELQRQMECAAAPYLGTVRATFGRGNKPQGPLNVRFVLDWTQTPTLPPVSPAVEAALQGDFWKAYAKPQIAAHDPCLDGANKAGYLVSACSMDPAPMYAITTPLKEELQVLFDNSDSAWAAAMTHYLASLEGIDQGNRVGLFGAVDSHIAFQLPREDGYFVLQGVEYAAASRVYVLSGWLVDVHGSKDASCHDGAPIKLSTGNLTILSEEVRDEIREANRGPHVSGKGAVNCAVAGAGGAVVREVSMKARLDLASMALRYVGQPFLVKAHDPEELKGDHAVVLDFDPFTQPDPVTGEHYTLFCFVDDGGKLLDLDPVTKIASSQDAYADELAAVAERLGQPYV